MKRVLDSYWNERTRLNVLNLSAEPTFSEVETEDMSPFGMVIILNASDDPYAYVNPTASIKHVPRCDSRSLIRGG